MSRAIGVDTRCVTPASTARSLEICSSCANALAAARALIELEMARKEGQLSPTISPTMVIVKQSSTSVNPRLPIADVIAASFALVGAIGEQIEIFVARAWR